MGRPRPWLSVRRRLDQYAETWLRNRLPRTRSATLNQRRIFILPTRNGLYFLLMAGALFLGGINYGNSLILMVSMLLVSLFLVAILHTYNNLSGLRVEAGRTQNAFVGQDVAFGLRLADGGSEHESIEFSWSGQQPQRVDLIDCSSREITLLLPVKRRGYCRSPRIRIQSCYPLGLLRAWSWLELDSAALVYPRPIEAPYPLREVGDASQGESVAEQGSDDFDGLRRYQPGDSVRRIAWKSYARDGRLHSKRFAGYRSQASWLEWQAYAGLSAEERLGRLCYQILQLDQQRRRFGLRMPGVEIAPGQGERHRYHCLQALALHGLGASQERDDPRRANPLAGAA